jgi:hypothetical protein
MKPPAHSRGVIMHAYPRALQREKLARARSSSGATMVLFGAIRIADA